VVADLCKRCVAGHLRGALCYLTHCPHYRDTGGRDNNVNAHRSRSDGKKVKLGLDRKFADGGTRGVAPVGYLNVREMVNGKEVSSIAIDPERVGLVQDGFEAFATDE
jgi:hypothetical protein